MKRTILITIVCTLSVVLVIGGIIALIVGLQTRSRHWTEELTGSVTFEGEIVAITPDEEGQILSVVMQSGEQVEVWCYEDTQITGQFIGEDLSTMLTKQVAGAFVSVETYDAMDNILEGKTLLPAISITSIEE